MKLNYNEIDEFFNNFTGIESADEDDFSDDDSLGDSTFLPASVEINIDVDEVAVIERPVINTEAAIESA